MTIPTGGTATTTGSSTTVAPLENPMTTTAGPTTCGSGTVLGVAVVPVTPGDAVDHGEREMGTCSEGPTPLVGIPVEKAGLGAGGSTSGAAPGSGGHAL